MSIKRQATIDYTALCKELGITVDELLELVKNKDKKLTSSYQHSFLEILKEYCEYLKKLQSMNRRSSTTVDTYLNFLDRVSIFVEKNYDGLYISDINEDVILDILKKSVPRKDNKLATNTINKYMAIIRSLLRYAYENGYTEKDFRYRFSLHTSSTLPRYLNEEQIEQVLNGALQKSYGYRKRAMLIFLLGTGCRVSELTNLKIKDFDIKEELIFIRKGKGNKDRYIPIFKEVKLAVLHYLKISGVKQWRSDLSGYLFSQDEGLNRERKILDRSLQLLVRNLFDEIGLSKDFTVHSFRHTFAVECLKKGIKEQYLMQMLGHEDPKTTAVYTKLLPKDLKSEVMKFYPFPFENLLDDLV
ncbi:tyrosine-type recombinase/integrase [Alkalihalophilus marmarensis]|uniref:tyrosine-type recombinase/integrase n=1 Tax=Alkalihalophilus marmarensis TaxID=521377 RepID=UPI002E1CC1D8|nr:tyrosine-type recombinase/integrase [Alkalihalophilus marmarensis]MED1601200.1 tyrosine-type recombinase/integrase [Alkalihalophilus marmarensis]